MLTYNEVCQRFPGGRHIGKEYVCRCPAHDDHTPSLNIAEGDIAPVFQCRSRGCARVDILRAVGLTWADVLPPRATNGTGKAFAAIYDYQDARGALCYQVLRVAGVPKSFVQRRPDGTGGWVWSTKGIQKMPYRLPQLLGQARDFICEGEKDVDRLWSLGLPATCNSGGAKHWGPAEAAALKAAGCQLAIILQDNDLDGLAHGRRVQAELEKIGIVCILVPPFEGLPPKGDVSDWLDAGHTVAELEALVAAARQPKAVSAAASPQWPMVLEQGAQGPRQSVTNAVRVLHHDPACEPSQLWYDEFLDHVCAADPLPRRWRDDDDTRLTVYMQETTGMTTIAEHVVAKAVRYVARQRPRHLVREWLTSLVWDQEPRLEHAFEDYWGVQPIAELPSDYVRAVSRNFFLGMAARILRPGCQLDTMVVFEGPQGIGKTSALRLLASEAWYGVAHENVTSKDFLASLRGKWLIEIGELDAFSRAEVTRVKTVISTPIDHYRPSYGRETVDFPRQCVFAGTTNRDDWGSDETGLRRFLPMRCGVIDLKGLSVARAQLFAEAVAAVRTGAEWWTFPVETSRVQADRLVESSWTEPVVAGLVGTQETTVVDVLVRILKFNLSEIRRPHELEVGKILRLAGWTKKDAKRSGRTVKTWFAPM